MLFKITDPLDRSIVFEYDNQGRVVRQQEVGGAVRSLSYESSQTSLKEIDGETKKYVFDNLLRLVQEIHPDGTREFQTWNEGSFLESSTIDGGGTTKYTYDVNGNRDTIQRPMDTVPSQITYDLNFNKPVKITPIEGASTDLILDENNGDVLEKSRGNLSLTYTRDGFGNLLSVNNGKTTYADQRDQNGLLTQVFDLHNPEIRSYDSRFRLATKQYLSGRTISYTYDDYDRMLTTTDSHGPTLSHTYDLMGKLLQKTVSAGGVSQTTTYVYDARDRLTSVTEPHIGTKFFAYDTVKISDKPISITLPPGRTTYFTYDKRQRMISKTDAVGATTRFTYDQRNNLTSVTDALGNVTKYTYDLNNRKIREVRPSVAGTNTASRVQEFFYDSEDRVIREITRSVTGSGDRSVDYQYDPLDRLVRKIIQRDVPGSQIVDDDSRYTYESQLDAVLMKTAVNGVANLTFTNEAAPPFKGSSFGMTAAQSGNPFGLIEGDFAITRDVNGEIASVSRNGSAVFTKTYDPAGRLLTAQAGSFQSTLSYDGFGRKQTVAHSTGESGSFAYDLLNRVTATIWQQGFANSVEQHLTYNPAGNVSHIGREHSTYDLTYDAIDQLTNSAFNGLQGVPNYDKTFGYDPLGNAISGSRGTGTFTSNFLTQNGTSSFLADTEGFGEVKTETTGDQVKNYTYRADGKINSFQSGNRAVNYFYDGLDRLVAQQVNENGNQFTNSFAHLGTENRILLGKSGDGTVTTYIDGQGPNERLGEVKGGVGKGYITDHSGSVLNSPAAGSWKTYGLMGEVSANVAVSPAMSPAVYAWQGLRYDPLTGQYDNLARQYNQNTGTFTSQDPLGLRGGLNLFGSRKNNPLRYVDIEGQSPQDVKKIEKIYNDYVQQQTKAGKRVSPGWLNNFLALYASYEGCGPQALGLSDRLNQAAADKQFDDKWQFEIDELTFGNETYFPIHQRVRGDSNNPQDPTVIADPHKPEFRTRKK